MDLCLKDALSVDAIVLTPVGGPPPHAGAEEEYGGLWSGEVFFIEIASPTS